MAATVGYDDVEVGAELPAMRVPIQRVNLVMYAGAAGDFNPIHWSDRVATAVGLPNVIAQGMFTMASAGRLITDWAGDPGAVVGYEVRFTHPLVVPDDDRGARLVVGGRVVEKLPDRRVRVELTATCTSAEVQDPTEVLHNAVAVVQLS